MRDDYRRGRAAVGVLAGKRRARLPKPGRSRPSGLAVLVVGALVLAGTAVGLSLLGGPAIPNEMRTGSWPGSTPASPGRLVAPASPEQRIIPLESVWFGTWEEAAQNAGWPLRKPTSLPPGFRLTALQAFVWEASSAPDDIVASYTGDDRATISFSQAFLAVPGAYSFEKIVPSPPADIELERIEIDGSLGYWVGGVPIVDDNGDPAGWDREAVVLEWQSGDVVYRLSGRAVGLEVLIAIARSLAPVSE